VKTWLININSGFMCVQFMRHPVDLYLFFREQWRWKLSCKVRASKEATVLFIYPRWNR